MKTVLYEMKNSIDSSVKVTIEEDKLNHGIVIVTMTYDMGGPNTDPEIDEETFAFVDLESKNNAVQKAIRVANSFTIDANEILTDGCY